MLLRNKALAIIIVAMIILVAMVYLASQVILMGSYANLEDNSTRSTVDTGLREINYDISSLRTADNDYATWDDTYEFIDDGNSAYIESNMGNNTLENLRLNVIMYLNASGGLVYGKALDLDSGQEVPMLPGMMDNVQAGSPLLDTQDGSSVCGVLVLPSDPLLVAACPILKSDGSGTPRGTLIMGRYLGKDEVASLSDIAGVDMTVQQYDGPSLPADFGAVAPRLTGEEVLVRPIDGDTVSGYGLVRDIYGNPALIIRVDMPRLVYQQGQVSVGYFMLALAISSLTMGLVAMLVMQRTAIGRISRLRESVRRIGAENDLTVRLPEGGGDEVDGFARTMNATLDALEASRRQLQVNEERLRGIVENVNEVVWETDVDLKLTYISQKARIVFGYSPDELRGRSLFTLVKPGEREHIQSIIHEMNLSKGFFHQVGFCIERPDCARAYIEVSGNPVLNQDERVTGYRGIARDVTERRQAEEALRVSEERLRLCAATARFGTFDWDLVNDRHVWSPETYEIYGIPTDVPMTSDIVMEHIYPGDRQDDTLAAALDPAGPGEYVMEYRIRHAQDNTIRWVYVKARVFFTGEGAERKAVRVVGAIQDITDRKRIEEAMAASLGEKEVLLKEIHHRVKNNLQIISSLLSLQSGNIKSENLASMFRDSQDRIRSMALIHEKLYQSKDISRIDFAEYVRSLTTYLSHSYATGRGVSITIDIEGVMLGIDTAIPCGLIINELVSNSFKYAFRDGRHGELRIGLVPDGNRYVLTVSDNGVGFQPGIDFRNTASLGLQLVTTLVSQLEGTIELDCSHGISFRIVFAEIRSGFAQNAPL